MTAQPDTPGPDTGSYEVIHLGGHAAVVVPVADFLRLRALEQAASPEELEDGGCGSAGTGSCMKSPRTRWRSGTSPALSPGADRRASPGTYRAPALPLHWFAGTARHSVQAMIPRVP
jgi:hypothetical protein